MYRQRQGQQHRRREEEKEKEERGREGEGGPGEGGADVGVALVKFYGREGLSRVYKCRVKRQTGRFPGSCVFGNGAAGCPGGGLLFALGVCLKCITITRISYGRVETA